jgi:Lambda phage tail tape-measure protein (Tape_meas_lam_C)
MPSLGTLFVDLKAETGGFVSALSAAAARAERFSREASKEFAHLGEVASQTFGAFGEFNPIISRLSFALETAGRTASGAMKGLSGLPGALGPLAALGAGATAGLLAATSGAIAVAIATAESAAKFQEMSRSTGLSASTLAAWTFAAKQTGVEGERVVKSLQLLSTNMLKAAQAPAGAATAFTKLGLNIRDTNGQLKNAGDFMLELLGRLSQMSDKTAAVGFARQTMGRGGADMLQLGDPEEIDKWISKFKELNPQFDSLAAASEKFMQTLGLVKEGAASTANSFTAAMLPALQYFAEMLASTSGSGKTWAQQTGESFAFVIKSIVTFADVLIHTFDQIGILFQFIGGLIIGTLELVASTLVSLGYLFTFDFSGAKAALAEGVGSFTRTFTDFWNDTKKTWTDGAEFINGVWGGLKPPELAPFEALRFTKTLGRGGPEIAAAPAPTASREPDVVAKLIESLKGKAEAELVAAAATEKGAAASVLAKAAIEAETKIAETRASLLEKETSLREQLKDAERGVGGAAAGEHALEFRAQIAGIEKLLAELEESAPQIRSLYAEIASGEFATAGSKKLEEFTVKTREETEAARLMAAAFSQGGAAVQTALEAAKIAPFEKQRDDLGQLISKLKELGAPAADIAKLQTAFDQLGAGIDRARQATADFERAKIGEEIAKGREQLAAAARAYDLIASAALKSSAAQREAAAQAAAIKYGPEHPAATPEMLSSFASNKLAELEGQHRETIAIAAAQYSLNAAYAQEIEKLSEIRAFLAAQGESTIEIDNKIFQTRISHLLDYRRQVFEAQNEEILSQQKIYDLSVQQTEEWDKAAETVGTLADRFRAMVNEIELEGSNAAGKFFEAWKKNIDGLEDELAKFIVTGKANWKSFMDGIAEQMTKLALQAGLSKLFSSIFPKPPGQEETGPGGTPGFAKGPLGIGGTIAGLFGLGGKGGGPNGSATSPFYVVTVEGAAGGLGAGAPGASGPGTGGGTGILGTIAGMFGLKIPGLSGAGAGAAGGAATNTGGPALSAAATALTGAAAQLTAAAAALQSAAAASSAGGGSGGLDSLFGGGGDMSGLGDLADLGMMAGGGRVSSGLPFIVGEEGPEVFVSDQAGRIVSSIAEFSGSSEGRQMARIGNMSLSHLARREYGGDIAAGIPYLVGERRSEVFQPDSFRPAELRGAGGARHYSSSVTINVQGAQDFDSFNRSKSQIYADQLHQQSLAHYRNRQ